MMKYLDIMENPICGPSLISEEVIVRLLQEAILNKNRGKFVDYRTFPCFYRYNLFSQKFNQFIDNQW